MTYNKEYKFTETTWFDPMIPMWEQIFKVYPNIENILEIGCYEGRATIWLCENVLIDPGKNYHYDVVDTFRGSLIESGMEETKKRLEKDNFIESNFRNNISFFTNINFNIHKGYSQQVLPTFKIEEKYDFIYIDASHRADDTFVDAYYAHKLLKKGGILIFDDYGWKDPKDLHLVNSPQLGIEVFNTMYDNQYQIIFKGYQVGFVKL
jgi:predicted O-methyltransferase YrrM